MSGAARRGDNGAADLRGATDATLDDIGVSRAQLEQPLGSDRAAQWARMARATGVDMPALLDDVALLREIASRCADCGDHRGCRRWLDDEGRQPGAWRDVCPNQAVFDALPRDPAASSRRATPRRERSPDLASLAVLQPGFLDKAR